MTTTAKQRKNRGKASNLKPWKPGQSGNPNGRPPIEKTFSAVAREMLSAQEITISWAVNHGEKHRTLKAAPSFNHALAAVLIMEGLDGNVRAISELIDRTEGKPLQAAIVETKEAAKNDPFDGLTVDELRMLLGKDVPGVVIQDGLLVKASKTA